MCASRCPHGGAREAFNARAPLTAAAAAPRNLRSRPAPQQIRHWLVKLNRGLDFVHLDDVLVDLKITPEVLDVPVPRAFTEDRAKVRR